MVVKHEVLGVDPAQFEIIKNALLSVAEEMKIVLAMTAYSPLLKAAGDYSCGIFSVDGDMVAQGPDLPIHLGSMPDSVRGVLDIFRDPQPGDVYVHNDPYHGGSHLPDVNVVVPAFADGLLIGYSCVRAHWPDIGSATAGSYGAVTEIFGEGLRIPPVRLYVDGEPDPNVERLIFANVRSPEERKGDLRAQVAACRRATLRMQNLAKKLGVEQLKAIMNSILNYSEFMMRRVLRDVPDGTSFLVDTIDGDGIIAPGDADDRGFTVKMAITKTGDAIVVDFEGSDSRVAGPMNSPLTVTKSGVFTALKMVLDPNNLIPPNSGAWRPVAVIAPAGSVVNAQLPAAVTYANHEMSARIADMTFAAMHRLAPRNVSAGSSSTGGVVIFAGTDYRTDEPFISYEATKGGFGARPIKDGINAVANATGNMMNTPVEMLEMSFPLRVEDYSLVPDTGGAGEWRGGLASRRRWRVLERDAHCSTCIDRIETPAFGLEGGRPGKVATLELEMPDGTVRKLQGKGTFTAPAGSIVSIQAAGAGGFGDPARRHPDLIRADIEAGYLSPEAALADYGFDVMAPQQTP